MEQLTKNILGIFGEKGQLWLANLPNIVNTLSEHWELRNLTPVDNMTFHYVAKAQTLSNQDVVLKISCDSKLTKDEKASLEYFDGCGSIRLIDYNEKYNALLLQQAIPGIVLKSFYPMQVEFVIDCYTTTIQKLHKPLVGEHDNPHISDWLKSLNKANQLPKHLLKKAIDLKDKLLASPTQQIFLHGDLHHDNILQHNNEWLAIDPKGIIGELEFELAAFDFIHSSELEKGLNIKALLEERVEHISQNMKCDAQRVKDWIFVRLMLSAAWWMEDRGDPSINIKLANSLF